MVQRACRVLMVRMRVHSLQQVVVMDKMVGLTHFVTTHHLGVVAMARRVLSGPAGLVAAGEGRIPIVISWSLILMRPGGCRVVMVHRPVLVPVDLGGLAAAF